MEDWRDVSGFEGIYQISNKGKLKSFHQIKEGRILSVKNGKGWYLTVRLVDKNGEIYTKRIHRLVAEAFVPNPFDKPEVNHKDTDKQNNVADNLEWMTRRENLCHAIKHNHNIIKGMNKYNRFIKPKTIQQISLDGKLLAEYPNSIEAKKATGVCSRNILQVASKDEYKLGKTRKQAGGFIWMYKPEGKKGGETLGYQDTSV